MGEQLKIDDPETIRLATKLAESRSVSITELLREILEREDREREAAVQEKIRHINAAVDEFRKHLPPEWEGKTSKEIMDELYEDGLPK